MAKTIKEMGIDAARAIREDTLSTGRYMRGFKDGANAVLAEIEKAMDLGEPPYLISVEQAYYKVKNRIKELVEELKK